MDRDTVAAPPWRLGGLTVRQLAARVWTEVWADEIPDRAAALSYYFLFALFPTLLFLTALLGLMPVPNLMERFLSYGGAVLPPDAASLLARTLAEVVRGAGGGPLSVGALAALWGASRGIRSIMTALNIVYDVAAPRPWWRRQLVSVVLTATFSVLTVTALLLLVFGERIGRFLAAWAGLGAWFPLAWRIAQWPVVVVFLLTAMDLVYSLAPAVRQRWHWLTPGSAFALAGWLLTSFALRRYVALIGDYNATYGSIGAVILLTLWLYLSGGALLVGAEINAVIARASAARPDASERPQPAGP